MKHNYLVFGLGSRILNPHIIYHELDINNISSFTDYIKLIRPHEIYNLAAQSDAVISLSNPCLTLFTNANTVMALCHCVHEMNQKLNYQIKIFQANSVEIFKGLISNDILDETNLQVYPKNPYAIGKLSAYWTIRYYRETYKEHMSNGIIFNAESPRRGFRYVTQKIIHWIRNGIYNTVLEIGDLSAQCDWIHASDVALAAYTILQQSGGSDYIINLGQPHTVREFITFSLNKIGIVIKWIGNGIEEQGIDTNNHILIKVNPHYFRPYSSPSQKWSNHRLCKIGWVPKYSFEQLIEDLLFI